MYIMCGILSLINYSNKKKSNTKGYDTIIDVKFSLCSFAFFLFAKVNNVKMLKKKISTSKWLEKPVKIHNTLAVCIGLGW